MIVDDMHQDFPELQKDLHWNVSVPATLPYTQESAHYRKEEPKGSAEVVEEEDNASSFYYRLAFPFNRTASSKNLKNGVSRKVSSNHEDASEYEASEIGGQEWG